MFIVTFTRNNRKVYDDISSSSYTKAVEIAMNGKIWDHELTRTVFEDGLKKAEFSGEYSSDYE